MWFWGRLRKFVRRAACSVSAEHDDVAGAHELLERVAGLGRGETCALCEFGACGRGSAQCRSDAVGGSKSRGYGLKDTARLAGRVE